VYFVLHRELDPTTCRSDHRKTSASVALPISLPGAGQSCRNLCLVLVLCIRSAWQLPRRVPLQFLAPLKLYVSHHCPVYVPPFRRSECCYRVMCRIRYCLLAAFLSAHHALHRELDPTTCRSDHRKTSASVALPISLPGAGQSCRNLCLVLVLCIRSAWQLPRRVPLQFLAPLKLWEVCSRRAPAACPSL